MVAKKAPLPGAARLTVACGCSHHTSCMDLHGLHHREAVARVLGQMKAKMHLKSLISISEPMLCSFVLNIF